MTNLRRILRGQLDQKLDVPHAIPGTMGNDDNVVDIPGRPGYVYVQVNGATMEVFNKRCAALPGMNIWVGIDPNEPKFFQVLDYRSSNVAGSISGGGSGAPLRLHGETHTWGGNDIVPVWQQQILNGRVTAYQNLSVIVYPVIVWLAAGPAIASEMTPHDLTASVPSTAGNAVWVLVTVDSSGDIVYTEGSEVAIASLALTDIPDLPSGTVLVLGAVRLYNGQTTILESATGSDVLDLRGGKSTVYNLDDIEDVDATSPTNGDSLVFNSGTGMWEHSATTRAPLDAQYVTLSTNTELSNERVLTAGTNIVLSDGGAGGSITISSNASGDFILQIDGSLGVESDIGAFVVSKTMTIGLVYIYCKDKGSAGSTIIDVHLNGTTIFTSQGNRPTLAYNDTDGIAVGTPDVTSLVAGDLLTVNIDQVATGARNLSVTIGISDGGGNGLSADEIVYYSNQAALLEPDALEEIQSGEFDYVIGATVTKWVMGSYLTQLGGSGMMEVRDPAHPMPLRGATFSGFWPDGSSYAVILDPARPVYSSPYATYMTRMRYLQEQAVKNVALTNSSTYFVLLPGAYGAIIVQITNWGWEYIGYSLNNQGDFNLMNEPPDDDWQRYSRNLLLPVHKHTINSIHTPIRGDPNNLPSGSVSYILLPATWSKVVDSNTYLFRDDFMLATLDTSVWNISIAGSGAMAIDTAFQWLKGTGDTNWGNAAVYSKAAITKADGQEFLVDIYIPNEVTTASFAIGFADGTGYALVDFSYGLVFNSDLSLSVYENNNNRGTVGANFSKNRTYRVRITISGAGAVYEIQGGTEYDAIGGATWTTITPNTTSSADTNLYPAFSMKQGNAWISDMRVIE